MRAKIKVRLFHELRVTIGESELTIQAETLSDVLQALINRNGTVKELLFNEQDQLRGYTLFYVNNEVQNPPILSRKLNDGDLVLLVPPAAGG